MNRQIGRQMGKRTSKQANRRTDRRTGKQTDDQKTSFKRPPSCACNSTLRAKPEPFRSVFKTLHSPVYSPMKADPPSFVKGTVVCCSDIRNIKYYKGSFVNNLFFSALSRPTDTGLY